MSFNEMKTKIIERFLGHCEKSAQMLLGFLPVDEDVFVGPVESNAIIEDLRGKFATEELVKFGIAHMENNGAVVLNPVLCHEATFVVLRDAVTRRPYELLTKAGCLAAKSLPFLEILRDYRTHRLMGEGGENLFVAFDLEPMLFLRACGLAATVGTGLDDIPLEEVDRFCESFDLSWDQSESEESRVNPKDEHGRESEYHPQDPIHRLMRGMAMGEDSEAVNASFPTYSGSEAEADSVINPRLVLVSWAPLELANAVSLQLKPVVDHLQQLQRFVGLDIDPIGLWDVEEEVIERLKFVADRRNAAIFKKMMFDATEVALDGIAQFGEPKSAAILPQNGYTDALARLHEHSFAKSDYQWLARESKEKAWREVQRLLSQQVVGPLRDFALDTEHPVERNLLMGVAELSHTFHLQSLAINDQLQNRIVDHGAEQGVEFPTDQFKNLMATADRLIDLAKVTQEWNQPKAMIVKPRTNVPPNFPRLPLSD